MSAIYAGSCFCPYYYSIEDVLNHVQSKCKSVLETWDVDWNRTIVKITKIHPSLIPQERVVWYEIHSI